MAAGYSNDELSEFNYSITLLGKQKKETVDDISEVMNMGWFRRLRDSKVPIDDRWLFHWFSLKVSDRNVLAKELGKFKDLFEHIEKQLTRLKNGEGDADEILNELYGKLLEYHMHAESSINKDSSKKIMQYHKDFVAKEHMLDGIVRRVEGARNRKEIRSLKEQLSVNSQKVTELTAKLDTAMEKNAGLTNQLTGAVAKQKELMDQQKELIEENNLMKTCLESFIREQKEDQEKQRKSQEKYYRSLEAKFDIVVNMNQQLLEENREMKILLQKRDKKNEEEKNKKNEEEKNNKNEEEKK